MKRPRRPLELDDRVELILDRFDDEGLCLLESIHEIEEIPVSEQDRLRAIEYVIETESYWSPIRVLP